jgi:hypothetical protein
VDPYRVEESEMTLTELVLCAGVVVLVVNVGWRLVMGRVRFSR